MKQGCQLAALYGAACFDDVRTIPLEVGQLIPLTLVGVDRVDNSSASAGGRRIHFLLPVVREQGLWVSGIGLDTPPHAASGVSTGKAIAITLSIDFLQLARLQGSQ